MIFKELKAYLKSVEPAKNSPKRADWERAFNAVSVSPDFATVAPKLKSLILSEFPKDTTISEIQRLFGWINPHA